MGGLEMGSSPVGVKVWEAKIMVEGASVGRLLSWRAVLLTRMEGASDARDRVVAERCDGFVGTGCLAVGHRG